MAINKVFYLAWRGYEPSNYRAFLESFLQQEAAETLDLTILCKGPADYFDQDSVREALELAPDAHRVLVEDIGRDIDVYRMMVDGLQEGDRAFFFNTRSVFLKENALKLLFDAAAHPAGPLVGCSGSYERLDARDSYPNPHLRTNAFGGDAALLKSLDWTYVDRPHEVECGPNSLTRQAMAAGRACVVVNGDGKTFALNEWRVAGTWRNHGQRKLLVADNRSEDFLHSEQDRRDHLRNIAWSPDSGKTGAAKKKKKKRLLDMKDALANKLRRQFQPRRRRGTSHFEGFGYTAADDIIEEQIGPQTNWQRDDFIQSRRDKVLENSKSFKAWAEKVGGHKWLHYFEIYDREVLRNLPENPRILEIGVYNGASARMWRDLSTDLACYVGVDIDPRCAEFADPEANIFIKIGSQDDPALLKQVIDEHGPFDLIIDDGSHESKHMIASFSHLFLNGLAPGGTYVVEDTHTVAWKAFNSGRPTFLDFAKRLTDYLNFHYYKRRFNYFRPDFQSVPKTPAVTIWLHSVKFFDSIVIFEKKERDDGPPQVVHK